MCYLSSPADDAPDEIAEVRRSAARDGTVYVALAGLHIALIRQADIGRLLSSGSVGPDLEQAVTDADRAVTEALDRFNVALCTQAYGEPYRLLEASHGGVARSMRYRLAQNRRVAAIEAQQARQTAASSRVA